MLTALRLLAFCTILVPAGATLAPDALAQVANRQSSLAPLYACAAAGSDIERLNCYERETAKLKAAEGGGEVAVISRKQVEEAEAKSFGLNKSSASELAAAAGVKPRAELGEDKDQPLVVAVKAINQAADGRLRFEMENGQVWRQTDTTAMPKLGKGPWTARIRKAAMGTFFLNLDDRRAIRAERVR